MPERIAVFGGIYNNYLALEAALSDVQARGIRDLEIGTQLRNTAALKLYGRAGFVAANAVSAVRRLLP